MGEEGGGGGMLNDPDVKNKSLLSLEIHPLPDLSLVFAHKPKQRNTVGSVTLPFLEIMLVARQLLRMRNTVLPLWSGL